MVGAATSPSDGRWTRATREQEGLWLLEQSTTIGGANNLPFALTLEGTLDVDRLHDAFGRFVKRQPALRTEFRVSAGRLLRRQRPDPVEPPSLEFVRVLDQSEANALAAERCGEPLDPLQWPALRAAVVSGPGRRHLLLVVVHHCLVDGGSLDSLLGELMNLYDGLGSGMPIADPPDECSLASFLADERDLIEASDTATQEYWRRALSENEERLELPRGVLRSDDSGIAVVAEFEIPPLLRQRIVSRAKEIDASVFLLLLAVLQVLQFRYAGGRNGGVATAIAMDARPRQLRGVPGMFANEAPLLSMPVAGMTFKEFLAQVRDRSRTLFKHRRYPFTEALARLGGGKEGWGARAEVGVTYLRVGEIKVSTPGLAAGTPEIRPNGWNRRQLMLWLFDEPHRLHGRFEIDSIRFGGDGARRLARHYLRLLASLADDPSIELADAPLLDEDERQSVLVDFNRTDSPYTGTATVHALVEAQARRCPRRLAVESGRRSLSYAELDERANQLAHHLRSLGTSSGARVAVCLDRSMDLPIALLGVLKAGAAYVPLDPSYPPERLKIMLEASRPACIVTTTSLTIHLPSRRCRAVLLDRDAGALARYPVVPTRADANADSLAYVIFTSGSTGVPKGVAMPHGPLVNLLCWQAQQFLQPSQCRALQFASPSFDVGFQEIFSTLATGGTLVPAHEDARRDPRELAELIRREHVRRLFLPFLALNGLAVHLRGAVDGPAEAEVITAGERLEITPAIRELFSRRPGWTLTNQYGPTESHVVTAHRLAGQPAGWPELPPIGRPIANARAYVLDDRLQPMPVGIPGELYLGGRSLARGYLDQPKLTFERFVPDPYGNDSARLYRTGDVAYWREDGELEFLDRVDDQVKIRGFRVEPGEIKAHLVEQPGVEEAIVVARDDGLGARQLVAYVIGADDMPSLDALRDALERQLPDYMVPAALVPLTRLPLTANGKLDRRALPAPERNANLRRAYTPPRTPTERALARIWAESLGLERVGVDDNFFRLGGHSLLAGDVVARAREALERDIPIRLLFASPTVKAMASALDDMTYGAERIRPIVRRPFSDLE